MSLFSTLGEIAGVAAAPFTGGASLALTGGLLANSAQSNAASDAQNFSANMANTTYQRGVADMKAAGLNPMLAYSQGGDPSPTGVVGNSISDPITPMVNSAIAAKNANTTAQQAVSNINLTNAQAAKTAQDTSTSLATKNNLDANTASTLAGMPIKTLENSLPDAANKLLDATGIKQLIPGMANSSAQSMLLPPPSFGQLNGNSAKSVPITLPANGAGSYFQNLNKKLDVIQNSSYYKNSN